MGRKAFLWLAVAAAAAAAAWYFRGSLMELAAPAAPAAKRAVPPAVQAATARLEDVPVYIHALGTVKASAQVDIKSQILGRLASVNFTEGQRVAKGQVLARIDTRSYEANLAQYRGELEQYQALLANAKRILARSKALYRKDGVSLQELQTQETQVAQHEASIHTTEGKIQAAQVNISYGTLVSPIAGYAGIRRIDPGNIVAANGSTPITTVTQISPAAVEFSVPQERAGRILHALHEGRGLPVSVSTHRDSKVLARGRIAAADSAMDTATGTVTLKALFDNADEVLYPNEAVSVRVTARLIKQAVTVPVSAVIAGSTGPYVWRIGPENRIQRVTIKTQPGIEGGIAVVTEGLAAGDRVVTVGVDRVKEGRKVRVLEPAAAPAPDTKAPGKKAPRRKPRPAGAAS